MAAAPSRTCHRRALFAHADVGFPLLEVGLLEAGRDDAVARVVGVVARVEDEEGHSVDAGASRACVLRELVLLRAVCEQQHDATVRVPLLPSQQVDLHAWLEILGDHRRQEGARLARD